MTIDLEKRLIGPHVAAIVLWDDHRIHATGRTVRNWIKTGLVVGHNLGTDRQPRWYTTRQNIHQAIAQGKIPPRRGNPDWRKNNDQENKPSR